MEFSVWLDGAKIGETAFEIAHGAGRRAGVFHPTVCGFERLPAITAMARTLLDVGRLCRRTGIDPDDPDLDVEATTDSIFETPEGHRMMDAVKINVRLQLHDSRGRIVKWETLLISDMDDIRAAAAERRRASDDAGEDSVGCDQMEEEQPMVTPNRGLIDEIEEDGDPIRYFISAKLLGHHAHHTGGAYHLPTPQRLRH